MVKGMPRCTAKLKEFGEIFLGAIAAHQAGASVRGLNIGELCRRRCKRSTRQNPYVSLITLPVASRWHLIRACRISAPPCLL